MYLVVSYEPNTEFIEQVLEGVCLAFRKPGEESMNNLFTAVTKKDDGWWIGWIEEVPGVNCQERTHEELIESLKVTLKEALEFNRRDAISAVGANFQEEPIAI